MIEAGACALQIENQVSDEKQCGHQDGKVTVPHEDFLAKIRAVRYAFLELGVDDGIIVTRTDSLGAGLTKQIAVSHKPGDLGDQYNSFLDCEEIAPADVEERRRHHQPRRQAAASEAPAVQPVPVPRRHRRGPLRARLHHLAAERRRPAVDRDREAAHRADRRHGRPHPRGHSERQARLQQLAVLQLDAELPPAGVRRLEDGRQGRVGVRPRRADERRLRRHARWRPKPTSASAPSRRMRPSAPASSTT